MHLILPYQYLLKDLSELIVQDLSEADDLIWHRVRSGLRFVLDQQEYFKFFLQETLGEVKGIEGAKGIVHDIWRNAHPCRSENVEGLLRNETEHLRHCIWLFHIQLQVWYGIWLETIGRH